MATYAALTSLIETAELLLHRITIQKTTDGGGADSLLQRLEIEIESLHENSDLLRSVLEKSPTHPFEAQMKDAAEQAQVVIERYALDQLRPQLTVTFDNLTQQLRRINKDLISSVVDKINSNNASEGEQVGILDSSSSRKIPLRSKDAVVVNDQVFDELNRLLFNGSSPELQLVVILGMGGIGKTTLARRFYNSTLTLEQFEVIGWVTVSRVFSERDMLVSLMASIQPYITEPKHRDESIENYIHKNLKGRKFLIVLDDVWSPEALRLLMRTFPNDGNESRILITTRQNAVAVEANPEKPEHTLRMMVLDDDDAYYLLRHKVFHHEECPLELEELLRKMAWICAGLPLAVVLVAGILLASNKSLHEWIYVLKNLRDIAFGNRERMVDRILSLDYKHLPHRLRSCLLYMGAFPEDHQINVARLVKQLSAQGFQHKSTSREVEQCVWYLVNRNLVSVLNGKSDGEIKSVCVHDMVRDFCVRKAQEEKFLHCVTDDSSYRDLRGSKINVSFNLDDLKRICNSEEEADDHTHTIMCFGRGRTRPGTLDSIGRFRLLKSLDLGNVEIESFPNEVLDLFLLRLLALGHVPELPPSISNLRYLETLIVNDAKDASLSSVITLPRILCLPLEIWTVSGLTHIVSFCCGALPSPNKQENSPLQNLETLCAVMNLDCSEDFIDMIPNLTKLGIFYFGAERATHSIENIERLSRLEKLKVWVMVPFSSPQNLDLGFPTTLRKLTLRGIRLSQRDTTMIGRLPRLQVLKLRRDDFEGDEWRVTATHGFQMLEYLLFEELDLRRWFLDDSGDGSVFPMLKTLVIRKCNKLNEIDEVVHSIPSLGEITVVGCKNKSLVESVRRIKQSNEKPITVLIRSYG